jgi:fatty-acyl-CoA synthase
VAVFGITHPHWIEAVTAVIVRTSAASLTEAQVRAHAARRLAPYKRPKYIAFAEGLPKNPSGKILKRDLRATFAYLAESNKANS